MLVRHLFQVKVHIRKEIALIDVHRLEGRRKVPHLVACDERPWNKVVDVQAAELFKIIPVQNFSRVARMVDENGAAVILKNNVPRYVLMEFSQVEDEQQAKDEDILEISKRLIAKNKQAYEVLAK